MHIFFAIAMRNALLPLLIALVAACGGGGSDTSMGKPYDDGGAPSVLPQCASSETCVQATSGDACRPTCTNTGSECAGGGVCQLWKVCCSGPGCTTALAAVCCPAGGC